MDEIPEKSHVNIANTEFSVTRETQYMLEQNKIFDRLKDFIKVAEPVVRENDNNYKKKDNRKDKKNKKNLL